MYHALGSSLCKGQQWTGSVNLEMLLFMSFVLLFVDWAGLLNKVHWFLGSVSEFQEFHIVKIVCQMWMCMKCTTDQLRRGLVWRRCQARRLEEQGRTVERLCHTKGRKPPRRPGPRAFCAAGCVVTLSLLCVHLLYSLQIFAIRKVFPGAEEWRKMWQRKTKRKFYPMTLLCKLGEGRTTICFFTDGTPWFTLDELMRVLGREQGPHVLNKTLIEDICKYLIISSQLQNKDCVGLSFVGQCFR